MKRMRIIIVLIGVFVLVGMSLSYAGQSDKRYTITITNITRGQVISPPIVFSHRYDYRLFELGAPASDALVQLAEDGMTVPLETQLSTSPLVYDIAVSDGPILPGESVTLTLAARRPFRYFSAAGMLVSTNDAFFAAHGVRLPLWETGESFYSEAYDAGSESNSEQCDFIPGPPCGNGLVRDTVLAEGYVHIHAGIHGIGDLAAEDFDWRNPVVRIQVQPER